MGAAVVTHVWGPPAACGPEPLVSENSGPPASHRSAGCVWITVRLSGCSMDSALLQFAVLRAAAIDTASPEAHRVA